MATPTSLTKVLHITENQTVEFPFRLEFRVKPRQKCQQFVANH